ncbi:MAG TPA: pyridoxamine 5'-phosphate oxidase family protein, partial [Acidimicrobiales bacterium]|nr:pyridoxamine 5'-phosphate oxidase family protein [Acidimicrobiales bacterium]
VGFVIDDQPVVLPTVHVRVDEAIYFHGSRSNRMFRSIAGREACVSVTLVDGLVLARSSVHHSLNYRSAVAFGRPEFIDEVDAKQSALGALVEHILPGRSQEARPPSEAELASTGVLRMEIEEASAKIRSGDPVDSEDDMQLDIWAGVVPLETTWGLPVYSGQPDSSRYDPAMLPASLRSLLG